MASKKCGHVWKDFWGITYKCTRNKNHHGEHTWTELHIAGRQKWWSVKRDFNYERYCGVIIGNYVNNTYGFCERKPGHKRWHKSWIRNMYITWKEAE